MRGIEAAEQRELFEKWAIDHGLALESDALGASKFYRNKSTRIGWAAWQAALARVDAPSAVRDHVKRQHGDLKFLCLSCGRSSDVLPLNTCCPYCQRVAEKN